MLFAEEGLSSKEHFLMSNIDFLAGFHIEFYKWEWKENASLIVISAEKYIKCPLLKLVFVFGQQTVLDISQIERHFPLTPTVVVPLSKKFQNQVTSHTHNLFFNIDSTWKFYPKFMYAFFTMVTCFNNIDIFDVLFNIKSKKCVFSTDIFLRVLF